MNKNMKVLHISKNLPVPGIGTVVKTLLKLFPLNKSLNLDNPLKNNNIFNKYRDLKDSFANEYKKYNLIHLHGAWTLHILLFKKKLHIPVLISPHGALDRISLQKSKYKKKLVKYLYMKSVYENATFFHALTDKEAQDIRDYGIKNIPIAIIPNGIDFEERLVINHKLQERLLKLAENRKIILSLSRLHESKGIEILIESFEKICHNNNKNVLFIVGAGDEKYNSFLFNKITDSRLENNIFLLGEMLDADKNTVYNISNLFVLPSLNEGFPLTVLEAYRQKIPVITTTATPFEEIADKKCGWYIEPTVDNIYSTLMYATSLHNEDLKKMGKIGYEWMNKNYNLKIVNSMYQDLYLWLITKENKPDYMISNR